MKAKLSQVQKLNKPIDSVVSKLADPKITACLKIAAAVIAAAHAYKEYKSIDSKIGFKQ